MIVVGSEGLVALGALALSSSVTSFETVEAEDVEALCQDGVLLLDLASRTGELLLKNNKEYSVVHSCIVCKCSSVHMYLLCTLVFLPGELHPLNWPFRFVWLAPTSALSSPLPPTTKTRGHSIIINN